MEHGRLQQIEEIYHAALGIPFEEREAFFVESCGADKDLRREVESLLAFDDDNFDKFIDTPPESLAAEMFVEHEDQTNLAGKQIAHYKVVKLLGKGGMGEVYLARDTRLNRSVALKILPAGFVADAERLKRFEREAQAVSALNHPNILTVHEFSREGNAHFLATEFIEGETLRERIGGGELSLVNALEVAEQAAFALSAAHAAGIVHRDIKPENIMIRLDGIVKVLDFGIAKLAAPVGHLINSEGETLSKQWTATQPGAMIGTLTYMSPEQVRGKTLDARSDVFSLGVVLYEMLTGAAPFGRSTSGDTIAAILTENPPPVTAENFVAPAELERILIKALKKNRDERYQTSKDFLLDIKSLRREIEFAGSTVRTGSKAASSENKTRLTSAADAQITNEAVAMTATRGEFSLSRWLLISLAAILAIGGAWWLVGKRGTESETVQPTNSSQVEVVNWRSTPGEIYSVGAFSPDGKMVAFASTKIGSKNIWVKQLSGGEAVQITKDNFKNQNPIWSPNGDEIAFYSTRGGTSGIWRMPSFGGNPTFIQSIEDGSAVLRQWTKNDEIYYQSKYNLYALNIKTGQTNQLTNFDQEKVSANSFSISADEKRIACVAFENNRYAILTMLLPESGTVERIFDSAEEIRNLVWHPDGKRVLYSQATGGTFQIFAVEAGGKPIQITFGERDAFAHDASADGSKILYGASKEESDVWGVNVERGKEFAFASEINSELWAAVAPDNNTVAFQSIKNLSQGNKICCGAILTKRTEPDAESVQLVAEGSLPSWSPDGRRLAFVRQAGEKPNLWTIGAAGGAEKQLTSDGLPSAEYSVLPYNRTQTSIYDWSPDGKQIAYVADENDRSNVWLVNADDASRVRLTDNADAQLLLQCPLWSADGRRIAFSSKTDNVTGDEKRYFGVSIVDVETKAVKSIAQAETFSRLLGFSASGKELILAEVRLKTPIGVPFETAITTIDFETGERRQIAKFDAAYLYNIRLSADKKMLAYVSNRDGKDDIWVVRATGGEARKITSNNDARLYFSTLAWSPDSRTIYFGKQTRYSLLSMVTNFK